MPNLTQDAPFPQEKQERIDRLMKTTAQLINAISKELIPQIEALGGGADVEVKKMIEQSCGYLAAASSSCVSAAIMAHYIKD